ncbi:MAG: hypothetical protein GWN01_06825 [Nitrosopumilaceae archaeon]|nr:hypothetical protein [Nitrosopumilaceae archaeon]NIU85865.1 hypothetical protein [Nitrosopumilaceae archaeon]NIX61249.1 hypothetical protein [Nitrosopumilaceae archaeon]
MHSESSLLNTSIELKKEHLPHQNIYYKLIIGTDPETRVVLTDEHLETLLNDLPQVLSTVIHSQVLMETPQTKEEST